MKRKDDVGSCDACAAQFSYHLIHNGFNDSAYAYCDACGCTALLDWYGRSRNIDFQPFKQNGKEVESRLLPCPCGVHFAADAEPRCPGSSHTLSPTKAASWIELNAPGAAKGWRWQGNWSDAYCIIINQAKVNNPRQQQATYLAAGIPVRLARGHAAD